MAGKGSHYFYSCVFCGNDSYLHHQGSHVLTQISTVLITQGPVSFSDIGIRAVNTLRVMQFRRIPGGKICVWTKIHSCQQLKLLHTYSHVKGHLQLQKSKFKLNHREKRLYIHYACSKILSLSWYQDNWHVQLSHIFCTHHLGCMI